LLRLAFLPKFLTKGLHFSLPAFLERPQSILLGFIQIESLLYALDDAILSWFPASGPSLGSIRCPSQGECNCRNNCESAKHLFLPPFPWCSYRQTFLRQVYIIKGC